MNRWNLTFGCLHIIPLRKIKNSFKINQKPLELRIKDAYSSELRTVWMNGSTHKLILGPALFNLYINDLPAIPKSGSLESFVDDSFPVKDATTVVQLLNEDLAKIATWCCYNGLLINPDKTKLLVMGNRQMLLRLPKDFHVTLLGKEVTPSNSARDLGMDATLSFEEHITNTVSYCFASLCQINRIKHLFDSKSLENVIHALVFSQLFYCSPVWSSTSKKNSPNCKVSRILQQEL